MIETVRQNETSNGYVPLVLARSLSAEVGSGIQVSAEPSSSSAVREEWATRMAEFLEDGLSECAAIS